MGEGGVSGGGGKSITKELERDLDVTAVEVCLVQGMDVVGVGDFSSKAGFERVTGTVG